MKYNDNELVYMAKENNEDAINCLYDKYKPLLEKKAREYFNLSNKQGVEYNDFLQEAMIGFEDAINYFDDNSNTLFYTFVNVCVERELKTMLTKVNRNKHKILNDAISLDYVYEDSTLIDYVKEENTNPEFGMIEDETYKELYDKIVKVLNDNEKEILDLKLKGFSYLEIAKILGKDQRSITNILYRIRIKVKQIMKENKDNN